jgi:hypothetical protein
LGCVNAGHVDTSVVAWQRPHAMLRRALLAIKVWLKSQETADFLAGNFVTRQVLIRMYMLLKIAEKIRLLLEQTKPFRNQVVAWQLLRRQAALVEFVERWVGTEALTRSFVEEHRHFGIATREELDAIRAELQSLRSLVEALGAVESKGSIVPAASIGSGGSIAAEGSNVDAVVQR